MDNLTSRDIKDTPQSPKKLDEGKKCYPVDTSIREQKSLWAIWFFKFGGLNGLYSFINSGGPGADGSTVPINIPEGNLSSVGIYHNEDQLCHNRQSPEATPTPLGGLQNKNRSGKV